jgi:hypothetical protein
MPIMWKHLWLQLTPEVFSAPYVTHIVTFRAEKQ